MLHSNKSGTGVRPLSQKIICTTELFMRHIETASDGFRGVFYKFRHRCKISPPWLFATKTASMLTVSG